MPVVDVALPRVGTFQPLPALEVSRQALRLEEVRENITEAWSKVPLPPADLEIERHERALAKQTRLLSVQFAPRGKAAPKAN